MTDEEIIKLAEKTREEKYCKRHQCIEDGFPWCNDCPITYEGYECTDLYTIPFLDGFRDAIEYFNQIIKKLDTDDKFDDDFNYYGGYRRAFNDIREELGM